VSVSRTCIVHCTPRCAIQRRTVSKAAHPLECGVLRRFWRTSANRDQTSSDVGLRTSSAAPRGQERRDTVLRARRLPSLPPGNYSRACKDLLGAGEGSGVRGRRKSLSPQALSPAGTVFDSSHLLQAGERGARRAPAALQSALAHDVLCEPLRRAGVPVDRPYPVPFPADPEFVPSPPGHAS
jgi:hypothetical protein